MNAAPAADPVAGPAGAPPLSGGAPSSAALAMIDQLIGIPTVSRDSNLGVIELARDHLARLGVSARLVYDRRERKANLFATLVPDGGRIDQGGLVISGHTDTVPVEGQAWTSDPFVATHRDGRIYGRGTADMKGFIAIALAWAPRFLAAHAQLPIHLSLTYDEETTFIGVKTLLADLADQGVRPAGCLIGEPTDLRAIVAHKGKRDWCCRVAGREAHSSLTPIGVNAIEAAARVIGFIRTLADERARSEPRDARFEVPYSTVQVGVVRGGIAVNVVPRDCSFEFEMRGLPGASTEEVIGRIKAFVARELLPGMQRVAPEATIGFEDGMDVPPFGQPADHPLVDWLQQQARTAHLGVGAVGFATEGSLFTRAGIPTVVMGPGSIDQAHRPDEYISLAQVAACEALFERMIAQPLPQLAAR
jgi:acetylornithine deacetylase